MPTVLWYSVPSAISVNYWVLLHTKKCCHNATSRGAHSWKKLIMDSDEIALRRSKKIKSKAFNHLKTFSFLLSSLIDSSFTRSYFDRLLSICLIASCWFKTAKYIVILYTVNIWWFTEWYWLSLCDCGISGSTWTQHNTWNVLLAAPLHSRAGRSCCLVSVDVKKLHKQGLTKGLFHNCKGDFTPTITIHCDRWPQSFLWGFYLYYRQISQTFNPC